MSNKLLRALFVLFMPTSIHCKVAALDTAEGAVVTAVGAFFKAIYLSLLPAYVTHCDY